MKKIFGILATLLMILSPVVAQDVGTDEDIVIEELPLEEEPTELEGDPGVTPDSPLWGIDVALDRIRLALARGPAKARLGLLIAEERLLEVRAATESGEIDAANKAEEAHSEVLEEVRAEVEEIDDEETFSDIEARIDKHLSALTRLRGLIDRNEDLPDDVKARLSAKFKAADGSTEEIKAKIDNKKTRFEIKKRAEGFKEELKVEVRGRLNPGQKTMVRELVSSIDESDTKAKVELKCKLSNGRGKDSEVKCKSEIRGDLTADQQEIVDRILASIEKTGQRIKIEIKSKFKLEDIEEDEMEEDDDLDEDEENDLDEEDDLDDNLEEDDEGEEEEDDNEDDSDSDDSGSDSDDD